MDGPNEGQGRDNGPGSEVVQPDDRSSDERARDPRGPDGSWAISALGAAGVIAWQWHERSGLMQLRGNVEALGVPIIPDDGFIGFVHADDRPVVGEELQAAIAGERAFAAEFRLVLPDSTRWFSATGKGAVDVDGRSVVRGVLVDMSRHKAIEDALRQSEARLALAVRAHKIGIFDWHIPSGRLIWTEEEERLFGLDPGRFEGHISAWGSRVLSEDRERMDRAMAEAMARGDQGMDFDFRITAPDGRVRHIEGSALFLYAPDGTPDRMIGVNMDVTERVRAREQQQLLTGELNHRVKNLLSIVLALASQSRRGAADIDRFYAAFSQRLNALASGHELLDGSSWEGAMIEGVVQRALAPFCSEADGLTRFAIAGPPVLLGPQVAVNLALALHELVTNAIKYGALSVPEGRVRIEWAVAGSAVAFFWEEMGGPPPAEPTSRGFGSRLIEDGVARGLGGEGRLVFAPGGVRCRLLLPLSEDVRLGG